MSAPLAAGAVSFEAWLLPQAGDIDITQQDVLVAVGRGIQQKDNVELAQELADALGGAVCASRRWSIKAGCHPRVKSENRG